MYKLMVEDYPCPMCDEVFDSAKSRGLHRRWNHENPWENKNNLQTEYVENRRSIPEIAEMWSCGETTIEEALEENNIKTRDRGENTGDEPYKNPDRLRELYHGKELSMPQIAEEWDCSIDKIRYNLEKFDIDRRGDGGFRKDQPWRDKDRLCSELDQGKPLEFLAKEWGCSISTLYYWIDKYNLQQQTKCSPVNGEYSYIYNQIDGVKYSIFTHQLVAYGHNIIDFNDIFNDRVHVHHKNGNVWMNNPENLARKTIEEHNKIHHSDRLSRNNR